MSNVRNIRPMPRPAPERPGPYDQALEPTVYAGPIEGYHVGPLTVGAWAALISLADASPHVGDRAAAAEARAFLRGQSRPMHPSFQAPS